mgnify:CR=1 FL=1
MPTQTAKDHSSAVTRNTFSFRTYFMERYSEQSGYLLDPAGLMSHTNGAMVGRSKLRPFVDKMPGTAGKTVTAVRITDLEHFPGDGNALCGQ